MSAELLYSGLPLVSDPKYKAKRESQGCVISDYGEEIIYQKALIRIPQSEPKGPTGSL